MWWLIPVVVIAFDLALVAIFATLKRRRLGGLGTARRGRFGSVAGAGGAAIWATGADFGLGDVGHGGHSGCAGGHSGCGGGSSCGGGGCGGGC